MRPAFFHGPITVSPSVRGPSVSTQRLNPLLELLLQIKSPRIRSVRIQSELASKTDSRLVAETQSLAEKFSTASATLCVSAYSALK